MSGPIGVGRPVDEESRVEPPAVAGSGGIRFYCAASHRSFPPVATDDPDILASALREREEHQEKCAAADR